MELEAAVETLHQLHPLLPRQVSFAVADGDRFVYYQSSEFIDLGIRPGDPVREGTLTWRAVRERRALAQLMEENPFRVPYYAASVPITKGDELQGCVTAIYPPHMAPTAQRPFLIGRAEDRWIPVPLHEIAAIESHYGKTWLHTMGRGTLRNKYNLTQLERMLPPDRFIRCHRAYIVNVEAIDEIHPDFHSTFLLVMKGTSLRVPVSQKYASRFRAYLGI
ncbi:MAG: hypothetical protein A6D91_08080 [Bacillaceae bacterium G1]|nr:LytR family transcriptional regulator [Bacillota bacterium]OJF17584.1 MAG: hypothetical protein A6D91_08080 [Bacillaceae bacterium G1]